MHARSLSSTLRVHRRERGQILVLAALLLPVLLGMAGMALDVGSYASERRTLQNAADAIALAAGQELPDEAAVRVAASNYALDNGIELGSMTVTVTGGTTTPNVRVVLSQPHEFTFMKALGFESKPVGAAAASVKLSYGGGAGTVPWSILQSTVDSSPSGTVVIIKYDSASTSGSGFGVIAVDGTGASTYEDSATYGATSAICSTGMTNCATGGCPGAFPTSCAEDSSDCDGSTCPAKTGNMTGSTQNAVDFRMSHTSAACDTFAEAFTPRSAVAGSGNDRLADVAQSSGGRLAAPPAPTGTPVPVGTAGPSSTPTRTSTPGPTSTPGSGGGPMYGMNPACNPWGDGACSSNTATCSRRIFFIPIIDEFDSPYTITGFALIYLEGYEGSCTGSSCDIRARFIKTNNTLEGVYTANYDVNGYNHVVKLAE